MGILSALAAALVVGAGVITYCVVKTPSVAPRPAVTAPAGVVFTGRVMLPDGRPATGATVRLYYCHDDCGYGSRWISSTTTNEQGSFSIVRPEINVPVVFLTSAVVKYYIVAESTGCAPGIVEAVDSSREGCSIMLSRARTVRCRVSDVEGRAVAGAEVTFVPRLDRALNSSGADRALTEASKGLTDPTGTATLAEIPVGRAGLLRAVKPGIGTGSQPIDESSEGRNIALSADLIILKGRVVSVETGVGLAARPSLKGMLVSAFAGQTWTATGEDGRFEMEAKRLPGNSAALFVCDPSADPQYARASLAANQVRAGSDLTIGMSRGTLVSGQVVNAETSEPLSARTTFTVSRLQRDGKSLWFDGVTDARGGFAFRIADHASIEIKPLACDGRALRGGGAGTRIDLTGDTTTCEIKVAPMGEPPSDVSVKGKS